MAKTVLIVDDNEFSRQALCELFQQADFEICADAENGREAIEMAEQLLPDLIVLDCRLSDNRISERLQRSKISLADNCRNHAFRQVENCWCNRDVMPSKRRV